jgi:hypothetical protein
VEFNSTQVGPVLQNAGSMNSTQTQLALQMILEACRFVVDQTQQRVLLLGGAVMDNAEKIPTKFLSPSTQELVTTYNTILRLVSHSVRF